MITSENLKQKVLLLPSLNAKEITRGVKYYTCALMHEFAKNPVRLFKHPQEAQRPLVYDKETIETYFKQSGNHCPQTRMLLTGTQTYFATLQLEQSVFALDVEQKLKARETVLQNWLIKRKEEFDQLIAKQEKAFQEDIEKLKLMSSAEELANKEIAFKEHIAKQRKAFQEECANTIETCNNLGELKGAIEELQDYLSYWRDKNVATIQKASQMLIDLKKGNHCPEFGLEAIFNLDRFGVDLDVDMHRTYIEKIRRSKEEEQKSQLEAESRARLDAVRIAEEQKKSMEDQHKKDLLFMGRQLEKSHTKAEQQGLALIETIRKAAKEGLEAEEYRKAAEQGSAAAQYKLGSLLEYGLGVPQDLKAALEWYLLSAKQGHAQAQSVLGFKLETGQDVAQDYIASTEWYRLAAEQGHVISQNRFASALKLGRGVAKDLQAAAKWLQRSAKQGDPSGQFNFGMALELGQGVAKDFKAALEWYQRSAEQGNAAAQTRLKDLSAKHSAVSNPRKKMKI